MPKISKERANERRNQILDAAEKCFARGGYHQATLDDIVTESGLSKGAVYSYFPAKDEILIKLIERYWLQSTKRLQLLLSKCMDNSDRLVILMNWFIQESNVNIRMWKIVLDAVLTSEEKDQLRSAMAQRNMSMLQMISRIIEDGKKRGIYPDDIRTETVAWTLFTISNGVMIHSLTQNVDFSSDEQQTETRENLQSLLTMLGLSGRE
ncbi:MAG: TetR/AcrR family transcriptional regulator [Bacilli bacterium]